MEVSCDLYTYEITTYMNKISGSFVRTHREDHFVEKLHSPKKLHGHASGPAGSPLDFSQDQKSVGSLERVICFPKIGDLRLAKIGAGGKPLVGDSLRTLAPCKKKSLYSRR